MDAAPDTATLTQFLTALHAQGFQGDIATDIGSRLVNATDNSIYQTHPAAIIAPQSLNSLDLVTQTLAQEPFRTITLTPRGGGTGTNGQSLTHGIVLDCSKYLTNIIESDHQNHSVRVQPGVVLDQLNAHLKPHGLFFPPSLSPSSRATLGGMVATDACGKGSLIYGKTSDYILSLRLSLPNGKTYDTANAQDCKTLLNTLSPLLEAQADDITTHFPTMPRSVSGYNLRDALHDTGATRLHRLIAGSEGTLGIIQDITLRTMPLPSQRCVVAIAYHDMLKSLRDADFLRSFTPHAIETMDSIIFNLAKGDEVWHAIGHLLPQHEPVGALHLVEFVGDHAITQAQTLCHALDARKNAPSFHWFSTHDGAEMAGLWELRKRGVGLLGNMQGDKRPVAFVEDTAVPPEKLADYISAFTQLLDSHNLDYGMFGHVDAGCLHVRPAMNMRDPASRALLRPLSDAVAELVQQFGGVMWGEHGKGYRAEYTARLMSQSLYDTMCDIKAFFDPHNQLNPGKIATATGSNMPLTKLDAVPLRGDYDGQIDKKSQQDFAKSLECNGNGACFHYSASTAMCPSYKATRDRTQSPKGRTSLLREYLRISSTHNEQTNTEASRPIPSASGHSCHARGHAMPNVKASQAGRTETSIKASRPIPLVSDSERKQRDRVEVSQAGRTETSINIIAQATFAAFNSCLGCKACTVGCPIHVDVPELKARFLDRYYQTTRRPLRDYIIAYTEEISAIATKAPRLARASQWLVKPALHAIGLRNLPSPSVPSLKTRLKSFGGTWLDSNTHAYTMPNADERAIILVPDALTTTYEAPMVEAICRTLHSLDYRILIAPLPMSGKGKHVVGMLDAFKKQAQETAKKLEELASFGLPLVGIDSSTTLVYSQEYATHASPTKVQPLHEWLYNELQQGRLPKRSLKSEHPYTLLTHCTESTHLPNTAKQWQAIFNHFGLELQHKDTGCCGMAGAFGHCAEHQDTSKKLYHMSWKDIVQSTPDNHLLATGYSCRSQIKRFSQQKPLHPLHVMQQLLIG